MLKCDADLVLCSSNSAFSLLEAFGNLAVSPVSRNLTVMHFSLCSLTSGLVLGSPFSVETILSWNISYFFFFQFYWDSVNMLFSRSIVSDSVGSHGLEPTRLLHPWDFSGKSTGVGCHFLLLGLFLTQWIKLMSPVSPALAGGFFYHWATWIVSLSPASFCTPKPNLPVTHSISWLPTFAFQYLMMKRTSFFGVSPRKSCRSS